MDRNEIKELRKLAQRCLEDHMGANHLYDVEVGNASFNSAEVTFKLKFKKRGVMSPTAKYAVEQAEKLGLKLVNDAGDKIVDFNFKAPKYPWIVEKADGRTFKYTDSYIKREFAA